MNPGVCCIRAIAARTATAPRQQQDEGRADRPTPPAHGPSPTTRRPQARTSRSGPVPAYCVATGPATQFRVKARKRTMQTRITVAAVVVVVAFGTVGIEAGQDPVAYCTEVFPNSYQLREICIEQERGAAAHLASGASQGDTVQTRAAIRREIVAANLKRFDNALVSEVSFGDVEVGETRLPRSRRRSSLLRSAASARLSL